MELRVLQYFLAIAREESISKAAEVLHITQPTLSRQIKELEEEFQKQLFIRGNRKITLTKDGILLKQYAQEILNLTEKAQRELLKDQEELAGDIYIGGGESATMRLIMRVIVEMHKMLLINWIVDYSILVSSLILLIYLNLIILPFQVKKPWEF